MLGRRVSLTIAVVLLAALGSAGSAQACSCAQIAPRDALRQADGAIIAELVEILPRDGAVADYRYRVERVYKSVRRLGQTVSVRSAIGGAACGLPSELGRRYGLFLRWSGGRWRSSLCEVIAPRQLATAARQTSRKGAPSSNCNS